MRLAIITPHASATSRHRWGMGRAVSPAGYELSPTRALDRSEQRFCGVPGALELLAADKDRRKAVELRGVRIGDVSLDTRMQLRARKRGPILLGVAAQPHRGGLAVFERDVGGVHRE